MHYIVFFIALISKLSFADEAYFGFGDDFYKENINNINFLIDNDKLSLMGGSPSKNIVRIREIQNNCVEIRDRSPEFNSFIETSVFQDILTSITGNNDTLLKRYISKNGGEFMMEKHIPPSLKKLMSLTKKEIAIVKEIEKDAKPSINEIEKKSQSFEEYIKKNPFPSGKSSELSHSHKVILSASYCGIPDLLLGIYGENSFTLQKSNELTSFIRRKNMVRTIDELENVKKEIEKIQGAH